MEEEKIEPSKNENISSDKQLEVQNAPPPIKDIFLHTYRLGKICTHFAITFAVLLLLCVVASVLLPISQLLFICILLIVMLLMILLTMGTIFAFENKPMEKMWDFFLNVTKAEFAVNIANFCFLLLPYFSIAGISCAIAGIVLLSVTKPQRHIGLIITLSILAAIMLIPLIVYFSMGGAAWQG